MVTEEEAREFLRGYRSQMLKVKAIEMTIDELRESVIMPAVQKDGMPHAKGNASDLSGYAAKLDELLTKLIKAKKSASDNCIKICHEIEKLTDEFEQSAIRYHYICGCTWDETAELMHYSRTQIIRIQGNAVRQIALNMTIE